MVGPLGSLSPAQVRRLSALHGVVLRVHYLSLPEGWDEETPRTMREWADIDWGVPRETHTQMEKRVPASIRYNLFQRDDVRGVTRAAGVAELMVLCSAAAWGRAMAALLRQYCNVAGNAYAEEALRIISSMEKADLATTLDFLSLPVWVGSAAADARAVEALQILSSLKGVSLEAIKGFRTLPVSSDVLTEGVAVAGAVARELRDGAGVPWLCLDRRNSHCEFRLIGAARLALWLPFWMDSAGNAPEQATVDALLDAWDAAVAQCPPDAEAAWFAPLPPCTPERAAELKRAKDESDAEYYPLLSDEKYRKQWVSWLKISIRDFQERGDGTGITDQFHTEIREPAPDILAAVPDVHMLDSIRWYKRSEADKTPAAWERAARLAQYLLPRVQQRLADAQAAEARFKALEVERRYM